MEDIVKALISMGITPENLVRVIGFAFLMLGFLEPEEFFGIKIKWSTSKRVTSALAGILIGLATIPQLQFWHSNKILVDKAALQTLRSNVERANDAILKARRQNAFNSCYDAASEGLLPLAAVYASLKEILAKAD